MGILENIGIIIYPLLAAFGIALVAGYAVVPLLRRLKMGQQVRDDGPQTHLKKAGTPTMGGVIFAVATAAATLIFARGRFEQVWLALGATLGFGLIGFLDDIIIVVKKRSLGLKAYQKIILQLAGAVGIALIAFYDPNIGSSLRLPFTTVEWELGWGYIPFTAFVVVSMVNGVNLTDGLDGLASSVSGVNAVTFAVIFLGIFGVSAGAGDANMAVFSAALAGGLIGFLRFNTHPAKVFMGDTGSFALGGAIAVMGIVSRMQILLVLTGIMFLLSAVSVILQVGSYKLRHGKRVFKMAPLHHHFELKGTPETKIVVFYTMITILACAVTLIAVS